MDSNCNAHLSTLSVSVSSSDPPERGFPKGKRRSSQPVSLFGLASSGACLARPVAESAVRSYRAVSPLPADKTSTGGLLSVALSLVLRRADVIRRCAL